MRTNCFLKAATGDFISIAIADYEDTTNWGRFIKTFERHGKGRITVKSNVYCRDSLVATHTGTYVAFKK